MYKMNLCLSNEVFLELTVIRILWKTYNDLFGYKSALSDEVKYWEFRSLSAKRLITVVPGVKRILLTVKCYVRLHSGF